MYDDDGGWKADWTDNVKSGRTWKRGFFMLVFAAILWFAKILLYIAALAQFFAVLISGRPIVRLLPFGRSLSAYIRDIGLFLTWNSDTRPFPFSPWPAPGESEDYPGDGGYGDPAPESDEPFDPPAAEEPREPPAETAAPANGADGPPPEDDADPESADDSDENRGIEPPRPDA
jgi:hypothetical protein